jgi:pimeloyl-ACP methyl ester carboxylesterase
MKKTGIVLAVILFLYLGLSILGSVLIMHIPRLPVNVSPSSVSLTYEEVSFSGRGDSLTLKGWFLPGQGNDVIILVNGGYQTRIDDTADTLGLAHDLVQKGYSILLFDQHGRGESDGTARALTNFQQDIGGAIDFVRGRGYTRENIGIIGFCSGAITTSIYSSEQGDAGAIVLDGCPTTIRNMVNAQVAERSIPKPLLSIFWPGLKAGTRIFYHYTEVDPINVVAKIKCPVFFIHEEKDNLVAMAEMTQLYGAARNPANEIWEIGGAEHSQGYKVDRSEYVSKLDGFFAKTLKEPVFTAFESAGMIKCENQLLAVFTRIEHPGISVIIQIELSDRIFHDNAFILEAFVQSFDKIVF